jgi:trigger factor
MKINNVEELSPTKRKLFLQIEPGDLDTEREEAYTELEKEAVLPGFRKGRVPRRFLEMRFDKTVRKEAFGEAIEKAIAKAIEEKELKLVGRPVTDPPELDSLAEKALSEPIEFNVTFEVVPPFELPQYKGLKLNIVDFSLNESLIDQYLQDERERSAFYTAVDDRSSQKGDMVTVEMSAFRDDQVLEDVENRLSYLNPLCGPNADQSFHEHFLNRKKGEAFEFDFPLREDDDYYLPEANNLLHYQAKILQISGCELPDLDDEFAKDKGYETLADYRTYLKKRTSTNSAYLNQLEQKRIINTHVMNNSHVIVPPTLINAEYELLKLRSTQDLRESGKLLHPDEQAEVDANLMLRAEDEVKRKLILHKIAETEGITLTDEEYIHNMESIARSQGEKNVDKFLAHIDRIGLESYYRESTLHKKVEIWLVVSNEFIPVTKTGKAEETATEGESPQEGNAGEETPPEASAVESPEPTDSEGAS